MEGLRYKKALLLLSRASGFDHSATSVKWIGAGLPCLRSLPEAASSAMTLIDERTILPPFLCVRTAESIASA